MPNWCATDITIHGKDNEITSLWQHLQKATECSVVENGFGDTWLGNIVEYTGHRWQEYACRGGIIYMDNPARDEIIIQQEDAWTPNLMPVILLAEKYAPEAEILFIAEEPGCELYETNDPQYIGQWVVHCWEKEPGMPDELYYESDLFTTDELRAVLSKCCAENDDINVMVSEACEKFESLSIHQFEEVSLEEFM